MTSAVVTGRAAHRRVSPGRLGSLVAVEARRSLTAPWLWAGIAASAWAAYNSAGSTFAGDGYRALLASMAGVAAGLFVLGVQAGARDHTGDGLVAPDAPVGPDARAVARLVGLWPAVVVAVGYAGVVFAVQHVEGGMWIADRPSGDTDAVFSVVEMLQAPALFLVTSAAGVAIGRATSHRTLVSIVGALVIIAAGWVYWAWQWTPSVWLTLIQTQPIRIRLDAGFVPGDAEATWRLLAPDQYQSRWTRVVVRRAMAGWHLVYLTGLAVGFAGLAIRGRRGRLAVVAGIVAIAVGIFAQVVVTPADLAGA